MAATTTSMSDKTVFWLPKIMYFLLFSAFGAVNSFLPVFYFDVKHLTLSQIGTLGLLIPLSKFLASPLYSAIADRFSAHRAVLLFAIVACVSLRSSLLLIDGFAAILVTAMAAESIGSVISPIFENGVLHILPDKNMYGRNRLFGAAGYGTAVLCSGLAIYHAHAPWPMFLISALLYASVAVLSFRLQLTFKDEGKEQPSVEYREISKRSAIFRAMTTDTYSVIFFVTIVMSGIGFGFIENYLFIYIEELGGGKTIQGVARFVMCAAEIPMFFYADRLFETFGTTGCLSITFIGFIARFLFYAYIRNPWLILIAEPLHGMTFASVWTAATRKAFQIAPQGLGATMQGIVSGLHFGLGQGLGALAGGFLYEKYSARVAFLSAAGLTGVALVLILLAEVHKRRTTSAAFSYQKVFQADDDESDFAMRSNEEEQDEDIFLVKEVGKVGEKEDNSKDTTSDDQETSTREDADHHHHHHHRRETSL